MRRKITVVRSPESGVNLNSWISVCSLILVVLIIGISLAGCAGGGSGVTPPIESSAKLTWAPPALVNPEIINLTETGYLDDLIDGKDYIIKLPAVTMKKGIRITGGHNVVIIGGHIELPACDGNSSTIRAIYIADVPGHPERTVHIEGVLMTNSADAEGDFIAIDSDNTTVQVQNCRAENLQGGMDYQHADVIQPWGGVKELRVDRLTGSSTYQGMQLSNTTKTCGKFIIKNVNLTALPEWKAGAQGGYMVWFSSGEDDAVSTIFSNFYIEPRPGRSLNNSVWPDKNNGDSTKRPVMSGNYLTWPSLTFITGGIYSGQPIDGDFVPAGVAGPNYVSPGYEQND